jgi:hypothetical protein
LGKKRLNSTRNVAITTFGDRGVAMSSKSTGRAPKLRLHKHSGRAVVRLDGKDIYLGEYGSEVSRFAYDRTIAEWLLLGQQAPASAGSSLGEITVGGPTSNSPVVTIAKMANKPSSLTPSATPSGRCG